MTATLPAHYDPTAVEQTVHEQWTETNAYEYVRDQRRDGERFTFVDGPPFTTGDMHVGTAWGKVLKDALLRQKRMQGYDVLARPGYDTHGLPVEVQVEARHDFATKADVEDYGLDAFLAECREFAASQEESMTAEFRDLGVWMDWDAAYTTRSADYVETVWSAFAALHDDGMVARDHRVVNVCPRCETALADAELEYGERTVTAAYVGFPLVDEDALLLAWTTTPWTVVGNAFVAVDREVTYAEVRRPDGPALVLAADCVADTMAALGVDEYEVESELSGADLVDRRYAHPLRDRVPDTPVPAGQVAHADYVDTEGTGVVHSAPGFGHEDHDRGRELGLPAFSPVDQGGTFTAEAGTYEGMNVSEAVAAVLADLDEAGALVGTESHTHEYPHCPRCDTDVVYAASEQWLVTVTDARDELLDALETVDFHPESARKTRFRNLVASAPDWNVSRQRYWGTPLPVWVCDDCDRETVVGSRDELVARSGLETAPDDLHRTAVDDVTLACSHCGGDAHRVADVLDVWFDSAVAAWHSCDTLPGDDPRPPGWPADLVVEGQDQVRGWFLMQLYLGVLLADEVPYERALMHGFAMLDGEAMSKSRGHVLRPPDVVAEHGRDALRCHLLSHEQQEQDVNLRSDLGGVGDVRDRLDVLWNVVRFATMYMEADEVAPEPALATEAGDRSPLDDWVLSRLAGVEAEATAAFEDLRPNDALDATLDFLVEDVSRYYVQCVRDRVWTTEDTVAKAAAYDTLGTVLHAGVRLLAPFAPFLAERLYAALGGTEPTVHATDWPAVGDALRDEPLEAEMAVCRDLEAAASRARQAAGRKHRWPVPAVVVQVVREDADRAELVRRAVDAHRDHLADRLNAKTVRVTDDYERAEGVLDPEMSVLGPALGDRAAEVADRLRGRPAATVLERGESDRRTGEVTVEMDNETVTVPGDGVAVAERLPEAVEAAAFDGGTVYVDTEVTPALRREGLARDAVRRLQSMRQDLDLALDRWVRVVVDTGADNVVEALRDHRDWVLEQVRGVELRHDVEGADPAATREWTVDGEVVTLGLDPVSPGE